MNEIEWPTLQQRLTKNQFGRAVVSFDSTKAEAELELYIAGLPREGLESK